MSMKNLAKDAKVAEQGAKNIKPLAPKETKPKYDAQFSTPAVSRPVK